MGPGRKGSGHGGLYPFHSADVAGLVLCMRKAIVRTILHVTDLGIPEVL